MVAAFYKNKEWALWAWGGGGLLAMSLWLQVQITVAMNTWYGISVFGAILDTLVG